MNKLLGDRVLIELINEDEKTSSGLIIKKEQEMDKYMTGFVIEVGSGRQTDYGHIIKPKVEVGQKVLFQYGKPVMVENKMYMLVIDSDIIRIL